MMKKICLNKKLKLNKVVVSELSQIVGGGAADGVDTLAAEGAKKSRFRWCLKTSKFCFD